MSPETATQSDRERLARIEVSLSTLQNTLTEVIEKIEDRLDKQQVQIDERSQFCAARTSGWTTVMEKGSDHEARLRAIEKDIHTKLYVVASMGGFIGSAVGMLIISYLFKIVFGGLP